MNDTELSLLLREVEAEMKAALAADKKLNKAEGDLGDDAGSPAPEASAPAPGPDAGAPAGDDGLAPGDAPAPGDDLAADDGGGGDLDPEALKAEYAQLPPEELKIHYMAAKAALFELMGGAAGGDAGGAPAPGPDAGAGAPPPEASAPPAPAPAPAAGPGPDEAFKSEIRKSEKALEAKIQSLTKAVELLAGIPVRKAITGIPALNKSEKKVPTRAEQEKKVNERIKKGGLSKSEHSKLVSWAWDKNAAYDTIKDIVE